MTKKNSMKGLFIYLLAGIISIFFLYLNLRSTLSSNPTQLEQLREMMGMSGSPERLALLSSIQPVISLIIVLIIGFFTAHKVGLQSAVIHPHAREMSKSEWIQGAKLAIILGSIVGVLLKGFDYLFQPFLPDQLGLIDTFQPYTILQFVTALLYGGIVEELLMRFGVMSLFVFIIWKLFDRKSAKPSNWIFILAIVMSALLFALGHYGANAMTTEMTAIVWFRMIFMNSLGGLFFGWLYWKYNLELAMLAHMVAHIAMNILLLILSFFI